MVEEKKRPGKGKSGHLGSAVERFHKPLREKKISKQRSNKQILPKDLFEHSRGQSVPSNGVGNGSEHP